jgi:endonuclease/exonuclease/phosphatase family metal-dependent hydrolase
LLRWLNIGLVTPTLLAYATPYVNPEYFWPIAVFGLLTPWLLLANALLAGYWLLKKKWVHGGISVLILLLGMEYWPRLGSAEGEGVSVVSLNCHAFIQQGERISPEAAGSYLAGLEADLICLQEFPFAARQATAYVEAIGQATGLGHYYRDKNGGLAVFSRYPLKGGQGHFFANHANGFLQVDVAMPTETVRLFNIHLQTNAISGMANRVATEGDLQRRETWLTIKGMLTRYGRSARQRIPQVSEILERARKSPHPVLLCGDFNEVPASYTYRHSAKLLADAFVQAGSGMGSTYAGPLPGLRIDYVMHDRRWAATAFRTVETPFSDHRAVRAVIDMP